MATDINALVKKLTEARDAYYNHSPLMSDAAFDLLEDELRKLDPTNAFFSKVGAPVGKGWVKVKHTTPMGSLNKAQTPIDMKAWHLGLGGNHPMHWSEKADGLSANLKYVNRRFVQGLTRGDGIEGEDVTRNMALAKGVVKLLPATMPDGSPTPDLLFVRGEIVLTLPDFKTYFPGESNPRNSASGTLKRQSDNSKCAHLTLRAYQFLPDGVATLSTKQAEFEALKAAGFQTPASGLCTTLTDVDKVYQDYIAQTRANIDYQIDGLVIDVNDTVARETLGDLNSRPKGSIALKFPHEEQPSTLRDIRWQVGASGRLTPVAVFDVVSLGGANVEKASLHNISNIEDLWSGDVPREGDRILCSKRNDVIPYVEEVLVKTGVSTQFSTPTVCPECGTVLTRDGEYLVCRGEDCPAQIAGMIKRWVKKIGVLHCGDSLIEAWIAAGLVQDIADLYLLDPDKAEEVDVGGRRAGGTATKAIKNLSEKKSLPLHVFVGSLGIPLIGRSMAKMIVDGGFDSLSKMAKIKAYSEVAKIAGVGQTKAESFVDGFTARLGLIGKLIGEAGITIQSMSGPLLGQSFCFTGFRDSSLEASIEKQGGTMKGSVSKGLTYLVQADSTQVTGKSTKALQYGTKIISIDEAKKLAGV